MTGFVVESCKKTTYLVYTKECFEFKECFTSNCDIKDNIKIHVYVTYYLFIITFLLKYE